jgi:hypothetical protein
MIVPSTNGRLVQSLKSICVTSLVVVAFTVMPHTERN